MITTEEFERWWNQEGSAINPTAFEDTSEHVKRVCEIAWANGHYIATIKKPKNEWQLIETAPKDGTEVVVVDIDGDRFIASSIDGQNWYDGFYPIYSPSHWMPLPAPPMSDK